MTGNFLDKTYEIDTAEGSRSHYDAWAATYESELARNGYQTPARCAAALAGHAAQPWAPLAEFGCGTGLGGVALAEKGFTCIDGFDISQEMLERARSRGIYRRTAILDLTGPLGLAPDIYQNAAAIGALSPRIMPPSVFDEILGLLPAGGCLVFSLNDHAIGDPAFNARLIDITELGMADLVHKKRGPHLPGIDLASTVFVLRKR